MEDATGAILNKQNRSFVKINDGLLRNAPVEFTYKDYY